MSIFYPGFFGYPFFFYQPAFEEPGSGKFPAARGRSRKKNWIAKKAGKENSHFVLNDYFLLQYNH